MNNKINFVGPEDLYREEDNHLYNLKTIDDCLLWLGNKESIALDTETTGLDCHTCKIVMLQLSDGEDVWVIDVRGKNYYNKLKPILENKLILGQNLKFDYKFLKKEGIELNNIYDTFLAECALTNGKEWLLPSGKYGRELALDKITYRYLGIRLDKSVRIQFTGLNDNPFTYAQIIYGAEDVLYLHKIKEFQEVRANKYELTEYIGLENKACLVLADIEYNGMGFDANSWLKLAKEVDKKIPLYEAELDELVLNNPRLSKFVNKSPQIDIFGGTGRKVLVEWSSPAQMLKLFKVLLNEPNLSGSGEKEINRFQYDYPLIKRFIDYKKDAKLASTYGDSFIKFINPITRRIHGNFWQILVTGRVSCGGDKSTGKSSVNLQNLPARNEYLNCFVAAKGKKIIGIDYKGQEARIAACFSKEETWLEAIRGDKDLHSEVAVLMFGIALEKVKDKPDFLRGKSYRDIAKNINFMALFGGTKWKLSKMLQNSLEEAQELLDKYFSATKNLQLFLNACASYGLKRGYIRSGKPYSMIRWFPNWKLNLDKYKDSKDIGEITRNCFNHPVQSTAAICTKLALIELRKYIKENSLQDKVKITHVVHDAIYTEVDEDFTEEFSQIQGDIMKEAGKVFIQDLVMDIDITIDDYWTK